MYIKYTVLERMYFSPLGSELNERVYVFKWDNNARRRTLKPAFLSPSGRRGSSTFPPVVGDWLQRHARMERDPPPPNREPKGHLQRPGHCVAVHWLILCPTLDLLPVCSERGGRRRRVFHEHRAENKGWCFVCEAWKCSQMWGKERERQAQLQLNTLLNNQHSKCHRDEKN